jgi:hypothetical protein
MVTAAELPPPLAAPVEMPPPAVTSVSVADAENAVLASVIAAVLRNTNTNSQAKFARDQLVVTAYPVLMEQPAVTVKVPLVVSAKLLLVREPPVPPQLTVVNAVRAVLKVTGPEIVSCAAQAGLGVHVGVPPPPPSVSVAPFVNAPVLTAAAPVGLMTTLATCELPSTAPVAIEPVLVVRVRVPAALKKLLPNERAPVLYTTTGSSSEEIRDCTRKSGQRQVLPGADRACASDQSSASGGDAKAGTRN